MGKSMQFPGFRFSPTDEELVSYFLKNKLLGKKKQTLKVIAEVNIYDFSPWDLPAKSVLHGDLEWYFFCSQSKKYSNGPRLNRATESGFWKATGKDRDVKHNKRTVATIKTLIFHLGDTKKGTRTNWVMHEFRMKDETLANIGVAQESYVICKVFEKSGVGPQNGAQYGAPFKEEEWDDEDESTVVISPGLSGNPNNASGSSVMNMISMEAGPFMVTSSAWFSLYGVTKTLDPNASTSGTVTSLEDNNTQEVEDYKGKKVMSVKTFEELVNPNYVSCSHMMNMISTVTPSTKIVDPNASTSAPSTIKYGVNERLTDDDLMLTHADKDLLLQNDDTREVEDRKGKKVMTVPVEEDDWFLEKLATMNNLDDLGPDVFDILNIDEFADNYSLDDAFNPDDFFKFSED